MGSDQKGTVLPPWSRDQSSQRCLKCNSPQCISPRNSPLPGNPGGYPAFGQLIFHGLYLAREQGQLCSMALQVPQGRDSVCPFSAPHISLVCQRIILSWQTSKGSHCLIRTSHVPHDYPKSPHNRFSSQSHPKNIQLLLAPNPAPSLLDSHPATPLSSTPPSRSLTRVFPHQTDSQETENTRKQGSEGQPLGHVEGC